MALGEILGPFALGDIMATDKETLSNASRLLPSPLEIKGHAATCWMLRKVGTSNYDNGHGHFGSEEIERDICIGEEAYVSYGVVAHSENKSVTLETVFRTVEINE
ncbi:MAG: hypothetical protein CMB80_05550 [Flammeovirgaceae bacterium]|nr:hypothetical protein [Flammeovirgaceae bacterium]|tara:strand:+ start:11868 stop:12182 length:315 start_codon:yes stop_codon:yes gene_type:complete